MPDELAASANRLVGEFGFAAAPAVTETSLLLAESFTLFVAFILKKYVTPAVTLLLV